MLDDMYPQISSKAKSTADSTVNGQLKVQMGPSSRRKSILNAIKTVVDKGKGQQKVSNTRKSIETNKGTVIPPLFK